MIIEKLLEAKDFTETEKHIAEYILDEHHQIENMTSTQLGKETFSSQSAIIRLYKKIGMSSYREFLSNIIIERNEYFKTQDELGENPSQYFTSYTNIQNTISRIYAKSILNTNLILNKNILIRLCNRLMNAQSIDVYGVGISHSCAVQLTFKLQSIGFNCQCHSGFNIHYLENLKDKKNNVSILITTTGCNKTILEISQHLKEKNIYQVAITRNPQGEIYKTCKDVLLYDTNRYEDIDVICSLFGIEYIVNIIYSNLVSRIQLSQRNINI